MRSVSPAPTPAVLLLPEPRASPRGTDRHCGLAGTAVASAELPAAEHPPQDLPSHPLQRSALRCDVPSAPGAFVNCNHIHGHVLSTGRILGAGSVPPYTWPFDV